MKTFRPPIVLLLAIGVVGTCTPASDSSSLVQERDSAGVRIVQNREPHWQDGEGWTVSPDPVLTIGAFTGPEEYQFVRVSAATSQSDGDLVVVDGGAKAVRLYDDEGDFVRELGGAGSGPGEFRDPSKVLVTPGDSVVVWDAAAYRITRFDPNGELAGVETVDLATIMEATGPTLFPGVLEPLEDGGLLVRLVEKSKGFPSGTFRRSSGALRVSADLSQIDTLMFFGDIEETVVDAPWGEFSVPFPKAKQTWIAHQGTPSRICIGDQEAPQILCLDPTGAPSLIRWISEPSPLLAQEVTAWREANVQLLAQKLSEREVTGMLAQVRVPAVRPFHSQLTLDKLGNLWAELGPSSGDARSSVDYLVFDPAGFLLGVVALPPIQVLEIGQDYVMGVYHDELEVEYLRVYALRK